jgi:hypothetical protein
METFLSDEFQEGLRVALGWLATITAGSVVFGCFVLSIYVAYSSDLWRRIITQHFAAIIGLPAAAITALFLVLVLDTAVGPVEIRGFGLEFSGAAGPLILWIFCVLALASAISILWRLPSNPG